MYILVTVLLGLKAVSAVDDSIGAGLQPNGQTASGSIKFNYFSPEGKAAADILVKYLTDLTDLWNKYLNDFRTSNNATLILKKYIDLEETVLGTKCSAESTFTGAEETINTAVKNCGALAPEDDIKNLKNNITQGLIKVQTADNNILLNSIVCASPRVKDPSCLENIKKDIQEISSAVSDDEKQKLLTISQNAFFNLTKYLKFCVDVSTDDLVTELVGLIDYIQDCKKGYNN